MEAMASKRDKRRTFVIGKDFRSDGQTRVTKGEDFAVAGGTKVTHEETVDIVHTFSKRLRQEGNPDPATAAEILKDVLHERRQRN
jgi:hypothetical protein